MIRTTLCRVLAGLALTPALAVGQQAGTAVLQVQAGLATADFFSADDADVSTTAFTTRFATRIPTRITWLQPVIGAWFSPYGSTGLTSRNTDAPTVYLGNIFTLVGSARTAGWLTLEVPIVLAHSPGAGASGNPRDYGRDVLLQPTLFLHAGHRLFGEFGGPWSRFDMVAMLEQNLTPNRSPTSGIRDRLNPVFLIGASMNVTGPTRQ